MKIKNFLVGVFLAITPFCNMSSQRLMENLGRGVVATRINANFLG